MSDAPGPAVMTGHDHRSRTSCENEVSTHDAAAFALAPALLLLAIAAASVTPVRRAMRVNPADVMRSD